MIFTGSDRAAGTSSPVHRILARAGYLNEWINMDDQDLNPRTRVKLIRQIVASDGRKYTAGNIDRSRYDRLVDMDWLTPFKTNISDVEYQVTESGRTASVANAHD
jgi:hypothetical protein